jgi:pimeloyl-ACP methyl ester carboxylesterase
MRGFGGSSAPKERASYGSKNTTGGFAALLDALDIEKAVFIGHDWGGSMVWRMCLFHPQRVLAVCGVCTPYLPPSDAYVDLDSLVKVLPQFAYHKMLSESDVVSRKLDAAPKRFFTSMFRRHFEFGDGETKIGLRKTLMGVDSGVDHVVYTNRSVLLSEDELAYYVEQYGRHGFASTCHLYGTHEMDFESEQSLSRVIPHKALFIGATNDMVLRPEMAADMPRVMPNLETTFVDDAGHWILLEQKEQVNALLLLWLQTIEAPRRRHAKL